MIDPHTYSIEIRKGVFEGEECFQGRVRELPHVNEYADTYVDAYALVIDSIALTSEALVEEGKAMPSPLPIESEYSGRVTLRLPKSLHASLTVLAETEAVSLNQLITSVLSAYRGFDAALGGTCDVWVRMPDQRYAKQIGRKPTLTVVDYGSAGVSPLWETAA